MIIKVEGTRGGTMLINTENVFVIEQTKTHSNTAITSINGRVEYTKTSIIEIQKMIERGD